MWRNFHVLQSYSNFLSVWRLFLDKNKWNIFLQSRKVSRKLFPSIFLKKSRNSSSISRANVGENWAVFLFLFIFLLHRTEYKIMPFWSRLTLQLYDNPTKDIQGYITQVKACKSVEWLQRKWQKYEAQFCSKIVSHFFVPVTATYQFEPALISTLCIRSTDLSEKYVILDFDSCQAKVKASKSDKGLLRNLQKIDGSDLKKSPAIFCFVMADPTQFGLALNSTLCSRSTDLNKKYVILDFKRCQTKVKASKSVKQWLRYWQN